MSRRPALRRFLIAGTSAALAAPLTVAAVQASADSASPLGLRCAAQSSPDGVDYRLCSGEVPSFDGTGLDVDLTLPAGATAPYPTIVMMHGWGNNKHEWESTTKDADGGDKYHWNNVWFASQGVATLTYTARGFGESCGITDTDANCPQTGVHLADRRWETKDSQTLLGDLVDAGVADPNRLGASGGSYGGGQSWLLATSVPWKSPNGTTLQLKGAVPKYPWTDLAYSLAPNGRENDDAYVPADDTNHTTPYGVEKLSYDAGLYATGRSSGHGRYNPPDGLPDDPASQLDTLFAWTNKGEPYDEPVAQTFVQDFHNKSAYYAGDYFDGVKQYYASRGASGIKPVPVFSIQGFTDPLFPAVETLQMYRKLKAFDPDYPVYMAFGDIGHSNAQNPHDQWQWLNDQANQFFNQAVLGQGAGTPTTTVSALVTKCPGYNVAEHVYTATDWDQIRRGRVTATSATSRSTTNPAADTTGLDDDPITNSGCLTTSSGSNDAASSWTWAVPPAGFTQLGLPRLTFPTWSMAGTDATLEVRLWDVAPDGTKTLADRGVYRITSATDDPAKPLSFELYGNCWVWQAGHQMQLQVTQTDTPYFRPDNEPSTLTLNTPTLSVPTAEAGGGTLIAP
jgi:dienelactone hydrolase